MQNILPKLDNQAAKFRRHLHLQRRKYIKPHTGLVMFNRRPTGRWFTTHNLNSQALAVHSWETGGIAAPKHRNYFQSCWK